MSKFQVKIQREILTIEDKYTIRITHNGYQWSEPQYMTIEQLSQTKDVIEEFVKDKGINHD